MGKATEILNRRKKYGATYVDAEYDTTKSSRSASEILKDRRINKYREELNSFDIKPLYDYKDFGLSEDKKREYKTTLSNYKTALENLKKYDSSIKEEDYNGYLQSIDSLASKFDTLSYYKTEDEYNNALRHNTYKDYSYDDIQKEINDLNTKKATGKDTDLDKTIDWLETYIYSKDYGSTGEYDKIIGNIDERLGFLRKEFNRVGSDATEAANLDAAEEASKIREEIASLENRRKNLVINRKEAVKKEEMDAYENEFVSAPDFEAKSVYTPSAPKTVEQLKADGYKLNPGGDGDASNPYSYYHVDITGKAENYTGEDSDLYTYLNNPELREHVERANTFDGRNDYQELGYDLIEEDEIKVYNYLYATKGEAAAWEYINKLRPTLQKRVLEEDAKELSAKVEENALNAIAYSVASVGYNLADAGAFIPKLVTTAMGESDNYQWLDTYGNKRDAVRGTVSANIDENAGHFWSMAYSGGMSLADMGTALAVGGGSGKITRAIMSSSAGSSAISNAIANGRSDGEAIILGLGSAAIEWATEKYSVEKLLNDPTSIKSYLWQNFYTEALEEGASNVGNIALDGLVSYITNSKSEIESTIDDLVLHGGLTKYEAGKKVFLQKANEFFEDMAVGGFTGLGMAGITLGTGAVGVAMDDAERTKQAGIDITDNKRVGELAELATNTGNAKLMKFAEEVAGVKDYENLSTSQKNAYTKKVSKLYKQTLSAQKKKSKTVSADTLKGIISKKLEENGVDASKIDKAADVIAKFKLNSGKALSEAEKKIFDEVDGATIFNEIKKSQEEIDTAIEKAEDDLFGDRVKTAFLTDKVESPLSNSIRKEVTTDGLISDSGKTTRTSTGDEIVIDKDNPIASIKTVNGERKAFFNTNQGVVESSDISYANETEALIHESFLDMHPSIVSTAIKSYDGKIPVQTYIDGMREGILLYGKHNFQEVGKDISIHSDFAQLSKADQALALKLGRAVKNIETTNANKAIANAKEKASKNGLGKRSVTKGEVRFENGAKVETRSEKRAVSLAKHLASAIGIDIVFYDAKTTKNKEAAKANGYFDPNTDTIYLDLRKSVNESKTIAFTMSHELVHFVKKYSPAKFQVFADFLMQEFAVQGVSTSKLLANKMAELNTDDADLAYEEMVADACERMLLDSDVMLKLAKLKKIDLDLFEKIRLHIISLLNKIREEYKQMNYAPQSDEAKVLKLTDELLKKFEDMVVDATENFQALDTESVKVSEDGTIMMQMKQYEETGRDTLLKYLRQQYGNDNANDLIATMDNLYNAMAEIKKDTALSVFGNWQEQEVELDENGHPIFTTSINNGDYVLNQDFSRVCKKRRQLNFVLNMLAEDPEFEASNLTKDDIVKINQAIKKHGFEIACALCFVDSKRFRQTEWADSFANTWNDILYSVVGDKSKLTPFNFATQNPNINDDGIEIDTSKPVMYRKWSNGKEDVKNRRNHTSFDSMLEKKLSPKGKETFTEGNSNVRAIVEIIKNNPHLRHTFRGADIIASDGFDSIQKLAPDIRSILDGWGGTSVPKPSSNDAIYDNSVLNISGYNAEKAFAIGGVRMNSFSDFMAHMFFDYAQAFADLSAKGLPMHSYTKELDFARLFGLTRGKINMSAIAAIRKNATNLDEVKGRANKDAMTKWEKSIAGLDISKLADKLGKAEADITYDDVVKNLDECEYVWADESIDVKSATLLQSGIMYDNLSDGQASYCYELIKEGKFDQAFKVAGEENVNREYAKHLGIITVGVSKAHILKLMRDPTIRMVIPYHKSGLNGDVAKALKILFYEDFTSSQNTMLKKSDGKTVGLSKDGAKIGDKNIRDFNFYDYFGKTIDGVFYDGKATASKYLEWCENGEYNEETGEYGYYLTDGSFVIKAELDSKGLSVLPKFNEFAEEENYYKLIEDFDCYDTITGEHSPQEAVDFFHDGLPADYKDVLVRALQAEQRVSDDFRDHLDNQGLRDEIMDIVGANGYTPSKVKKQAKPTSKNVYDYTKSFEDQIDDYKKGLIPVNDTLLVSGTPKVWQDVGFNALPVTINQTHVDYALNGTKDIDHHIGEALLKDLPNAIKNPLAIIQSQTKQDRAVVILETEHNGKKIISAIEIDGQGRANNIAFDSNSMTTLFAKGNALTQLNNAINNTVNGNIELFYWNKKEAKTLLQRAGLQLSSALPRDGFVHSIRENGSKVKYKFDSVTETQQFKRWFGDWQINPNKASKVVDSNGNPLVVFHGTSGDIAVFDRNFIGKYDNKTSPVKDIGFFFTTDRKLAEEHASGAAYEEGLNGNGTVIEAYLNIRKPLVVEVDEWYARKKYYDTQLWYDKNRADILNKFNSGKYDGIIITNPVRPNDMMFMVMESTQIKSATDNIGTFDKNNPNIRYQKKRVTPEEDAAYMEAVNRGDTESAQRMVDEVAKKAGYAVKAYHGTSSFGFTKFDPAKSDDKTSLFFTDKIDVAKTYAGRDIYGVKSVAEAKSFKYERGKVYTEAELLAAHDVIQSKYHVYGLTNVNVEKQTLTHAGTRYSAKQIIEMADSIVKEGIYGVFLNTDNFLEVDAEYHGWSGIRNPLVNEWKYKINFQGEGDFNYFKAKADDMFRLELLKNGESVYSGTINFSEMHSLLRNAIGIRTEMAIRHATDGSGEGSSSFATAFSDKNGNYENPYINTRELAKQAKKQGYNGVTIKNLFDYGGKNPPVAAKLHLSGKEGAATIYILFDSNQVKSADPVTYDADGNVIPLSERFNRENDDIRYQKKKPTNRELLSNALESTIDTSTQAGQNELDTLQKYKNDISKIEELETHLTDVKSEIYRLSFSKGNKDMARLRELREDKIKTENRLNVLDKKILRVEATKPIRDILAREKDKVRRSEKEKAKEALDKFKEKSNAALKEVMKHNQESRQKNVEGRHKTEMRKKIKGVVNDLDKMLKAGRKKANVKVGMRDAVEQALATAELLFSSNITNEDIVRNGVSATTSAESIKLNRYMDLLAKREHYVDTIEAMVKVSPNANTDGQYQMIDAIDREIGTLNKELSDVFERERNRLNEVVISSAIQDLADTYKAIGESEYSYISGAYNEFVYKRLLALKEGIGGTTIRDMSMYQLQEVYDAYKMVLHVVRTANTLFKEGKSVDAIAGAVIDEVNAVAKARMRSVAAEKLNSFLWAEMKPRTAFEKIGSDTLLGLYDNLRKGEDTFAMDVYDAFKFAESIREKYNFKKWDMKSRIDFKLDNGKTFSINLQQLMSIYAYSKREQALKHMTEGGFVLDSKETFKKDKKGIFEMIPTAETYRLSANDITRLIDTLTNEHGSAKNYVDEMQKYLTDMGEKGNEVSRIVFGIDLFKEKVYFPLKSSHDYIQSNNDALDKNNAQKSLISSGMTKETVPNARNPIVLSSFDSVWASHTNQMSLYHSFVPALEDFRKVYQYSSSADGVDDASVRAEIRKVFGDNAVDYISKLLDDINGGMPTNEVSGWLMNMFGTFKKTAVGMSLSTVIQQPTAIIRAWSILNPKYFVGVPHNNFSSEQWEEIKKYAPIAILKEIGGFDAGSGRGMVDYLSGDVNKNTLKKVSGKIDDVSMWLAGEGDVLGWGMIWNAVKREVKETTNLTEGTEEFLTKCGERFTEVITETQVYDSTFSRSGIMRSKNELNKFATSFMAEPTTSINMLYRAVLNAKRGKISKGKATATIGSVVASQFVASALVSLIYAARDDDDDETYAEKYAESFGGRMINATPIGLLNMLPYLRDIQSIFDGWDVERPDMAIFADIKNAFDGFASKSKTPYMKWRDFITAITNAFGVPLGNAERDLRAIFYNIPKMIFDDVTPTWDNTLEAFGDGFTGKDTSKKDRAWNAYKKGDTSKVKETVNDLIDDKVKSGKTAKEAKSAVRSSFTSTYKKKYLEAVENKDYNLMNEIRKFLHATGLYGSLSELDESLKDWRTSK